MLKSIPILAVISTIAMLASSPAVAQMHMTKLPWRIEEVLTNPDLGAVLRNSKKAKSFQANNRIARNTIRDYSPTLPPFDKSAFEASHNRYRPPTGVKRDSLTAPANPTDQTPRVADRSNLGNSSIRDTDESGLKRPSDQLPDSFPAGSENLDAGGDSSQTSPPNEEVQELGKLQVRVIGAAAMIESQAADLTVEVLNPTKNKLGPVDVNVQIPDAITITRFDRDAWLDDKRRIVAFRLEEIAPGQTQAIRLRGVSHTAGKTSLQVMLSSGKQLIATKKYNTQVFPQQLAKKYNFGDSEPEIITK